MRIRTNIVDTRTGQIYFTSTSRNVFDLKIKVNNIKSACNIFINELEKHPNIQLQIISLGDDVTQPDI